VYESVRTVTVKGVQLHITPGIGYVIKKLYITILYGGYILNLMLFVLCFVTVA
jgi:hypothetical protein